MSTLFLRTLREDPAEAEVPSHRLLVRAGYIRRAAPGGYTWLPLGKRVLDKIAAIVREEMAAIGGQPHGGSVTQTPGHGAGRRFQRAVGGFTTRMSRTTM